MLRGYLKYSDYISQQFQEQSLTATCIPAVYSVHQVANLNVIVHSLLPRLQQLCSVFLCFTALYVRHRPGICGLEGSASIQSSRVLIKVFFISDWMDVRGCEGTDGSMTMCENCYCWYLNMLYLQRRPITISYDGNVVEYTVRTSQHKLKEGIYTFFFHPEMVPLQPATKFWKQKLTVSLCNWSRELGQHNINIIKPLNRYFLNWAEWSQALLLRINLSVIKTFKAISTCHCGHNRKKNKNPLRTLLRTECNDICAFI